MLSTTAHDELVKIIAHATNGGRPAVGTEIGWVNSTATDISRWILERDARILDALEDEQLEDEPATQEDVAYAHAITDATNAVKTAMSKPAKR
jgi:hypothetical protein